MMKKTSKPKLCKGMLIVFEGIDGSGKSMQAEIAAKALKDAGLEVVNVREPGGTPVGEALRELLLRRGDLSFLPETETLLFWAARIELLSKVIAPAIKAKKIVICDRFFYSTRIHQILHSRLMKEKDQFVSTDDHQELLDALEGRVLLSRDRYLYPDITFWLDVSNKIASDRLDLRSTNKKKDRLESKGFSYLKKINEAYKSIMSRESGVKRIDGSKSPEIVKDKILSVLEDEINLLLMSKDNIKLK